MRLREQYQQVQELNQQIQEIRNHVRQHRDAYLFGAGVLVGVVGLRLLGRPSVIVHNTIQGA